MNITLPVARPNNAASVRPMGGQWQREVLQFRSRSSNPDAFLYKGVKTESLLREADNASKMLPPEM